MTLSLSILPPVIAHRGASAYAPENTLVAFKLAKQLGVHWIEFDVVQAADGEPIIFHDETLDRTTSGKGAVFDYPFSSLRTLDAGSWFNPAFANELIPSLKEGLVFLQEIQLNANIEIKAIKGHEECHVKKVLETVAPFMDNGCTFLFSSFSIDALRCLRSLAPTSLIGLLLHEWISDWQAICKWLLPASIHVNEEIITATRAKEIKDKGNQLFCYTVNSPERAKELFKLGVDAVFTDVPDVILKSLI